MELRTPARQESRLTKADAPTDLFVTILRPDGSHRDTSEAAYLFPPYIHHLGSISLHYLRIGRRSVPERGFEEDAEQFQLFEAGHVPGHIGLTFFDRHNSCLAEVHRKCPGFWVISVRSVPV